MILMQKLLLMAWFALSLIIFWIIITANLNLMHRQFLRTSIPTASERKWCQCWVKEVKQRLSAHWAKIKIHSWDIAAMKMKSHSLFTKHKNTSRIHCNFRIFFYLKYLCINIYISKMMFFVYLKLQELCEIYTWKKPPFSSKLKKKKIRDNENCIKNRN